jgi:glutamine synthetase
VITIKEVSAQIETHGIQTVILAGTDPIGVQRGKRVSVPYFLKCYEDGINFASYIMTTTTMDEVLPGVFDTGIPDVRGIPDLTSFRIAPWENNTAICLMDWHYPDGRPHPLCPRGELKRQVARLRERGHMELFSLELEFYLFRTPLAAVRAGGWATIESSQKDIHCYSVIEGFHWESVVSQIRASFGDQIEGCMPEWGPGQFEINLYRSDAISMADTAVIFKIAVKEIAAKAGFSATFMAKWHEDHTGSSGHIHQSLRDAKTGKSAFHEEARPHRMSRLFESYTAGQLRLFRPLILLFAPNQNSYKRFQPDSFAGSTQTWGIDNRTVTYRVINTSESRCRLETRVGGADVNPYLAFAGCIGAGLWGIDQDLSLPPPGTGNCYNAAGVVMAPRSLEEAARELAESTVAREAVSPPIIDNLVRIALWEADVFKAKVTDLERRRYFEMA